MTPPKIIIIDDDIALHRVFSRILQKEGYTIQTASFAANAPVKPAMLYG